MSAASFTSVMVIDPTRGSFTSRATSSDSTRCISPSMRRCRCFSAMSLTRALLQRTRHLDTREALDLVVHANVLIVLHADTALGAGPHFVDVVLEAAERLQRAFEDDHVVAEHANRIVALDRAFRDETAGDHAELARTEHLAHLRRADDLFFDLR